LCSESSRLNLAISAFALALVKWTILPVFASKSIVDSVLQTERVNY